MATYNFKQNTTFYVVYGGLQYRLDVYPDVTFSQTFSEESVSVKTLHEPKNNFEAAVITRANPANFSFSIPILREADLKIVFNLLIDYDGNNIKSFDFYAKTDYDVYKIETAVIENGTFIIEKDGILSLSLTGTGSKLSRVGQAGVYTIPGTPQTRSTTRTHIIPRVVYVAVGGVELDSVAEVTLQLQNNIKWLPAATLHASLAVTNAGDTIYPTSFILENRLLSGSIDQNVTSSTLTNLQSWSTNSSVVIKTGNGSSYTIEANISTAVFTNRVNSSDVFTQTYDFRMVNNPASLSTVLIYN